MMLTDDIEVLNADCMDIMRQYPDKHFDVAVVDPPYGINIGTVIGGGANRLVKVGGEKLSRPKVIGGLMTHKSPIKNTLKSWQGSAVNRLYGVAIISLSI